MLFLAINYQLISKLGILLFVTISLATTETSQAKDFSKNRLNKYLIAQSNVNNPFSNFDTTRQQIQRIIPQPSNTKKIYALFLVLGRDDLSVDAIFTIYSGYNAEWEYERNKWIEAIYYYQVNRGIENPNGLMLPNSQTAKQLNKDVSKVFNRI